MSYFYLLRPHVQLFSMPQNVFNIKYSTVQKFKADAYICSVTPSFGFLFWALKANVRKHST